MTMKELELLKSKKIPKKSRYVTYNIDHKIIELAEVSSVGSPIIRKHDTFKSIIKVEQTYEMKNGNVYTNSKSFLAKYHDVSYKNIFNMSRTKKVVWELSEYFENIDQEGMEEIKEFHNTLKQFQKEFVRAVVANTNNRIKQEVFMR